MTLFAGAYCLSSNAQVSESIKAGINKYLVAKDGIDGHRTIANLTGFYIETWDSGAFGEESWLENSQGSIAKVAGDMLVSRNGVLISRAVQAQLLSDDFDACVSSLLPQARGSFAFASYDARNHRLRLGTDPIGLRSVYYTLQDGVLIFATALRILESISAVYKTLSHQGMMEMSVFSFPLADRTPYSEISVLRECQVLSITTEGLKLDRYYDWNVEPDPKSDLNDTLAHLFDVFRQAVVIRSGNDKSVYSFLSGGMDSRAIVTTLIESGKTVEALNFSATASQDQHFAQGFSKQVPLSCTLNCLPGGIYPNFSFLALAAKSSLEKTRGVSVDRPRFIWSGDGGSVGLGHVYMDEKMLQLADSDGMKAAAEYFLKFNKISLPNGILRAEFRESLPEELIASVLAEFNRYPRLDKGRQIYLFLLFNDQRRHLFRHFETIDSHGLELLTPFYDADFLKAITATPSHWGILHRLYAKWFDQFPAFARNTPWQTYPGHIPCPVETEVLGSYQWQNSSDGFNAPLSDRLKLAARLLNAYDHNLEPRIFSGGRIWLAAALHTLGLRDCTHIFSMLQTYARHAAIVDQTTA